jgi:arginyl-tRNA synthetase
MSKIRDCITRALVGVLSDTFKTTRESIEKLFSTGRLKLTPTPDPKLGDYGISLHILLKNYDKSSWEEIGSKLCNAILEAAREECGVEKAEFINGYLNMTVSHDRVLLDLAKLFLNNEISRDLSGIGAGRKVIVEHTSANPVHPLHIGSGRNSVLGDVLARLLKKLGFTVDTRFYVNDLGRQVATLTYGVQIAESAGIRKPDDAKIDHWYGVIYAITNTLIELDKLRSSLNNIGDSVLSLLRKLLEALREKSKQGEFLELSLILTEIQEKTKFVHNSPLLFKKLYKACRVHAKKLSEDPDLAPLVNQILDALGKYREAWIEYKRFHRAEMRLSTTYPHLYSSLKSAIKSYVEAEDSIKEITKRAESGDEEILSTIRRVTQDILEGFKSTLSKLDIAFNGFDFESSSEILGLAREVVNKISRTKYARVLESGAVEVDLNSAAQDYSYVRDLFYPDQAGRFIIMRSDGTTLYTTRDAAYTLYKFRALGASEVYNVIAVEQEREQKQVKATLYILGYDSEAEKLHHFMYEMVQLKGVRMSGRRGVYYTMDELLLDMEECVYRSLIRERGAPAGPEDVISKLAVANTRSLLLSVEPGKVLSLDPSKLCEYEQGTIIEYAFVRAQSILRNAFNLEPLEDPVGLSSKIREILEQINSSFERRALSVEEKLLVELLVDLKTTLLEAYRELKLNRILEYAVKLALQFNKFYEKCPVIGERNEKTKAWRLLLVYVTHRVLLELLDVLGLPKLKRI